MRIATVLFDFYGTLVEPAGPARTLRDLMSDLGVDLSDEVASRWHVDRLDGTAHEDASVSRERYEAWEDARWTALLSDAEITDPGRVTRLIGGMREAIGAFRVAPFAEAHGVLEDLRRADLRIGVCSNWHWDLAPYLDDVGLSDLIDIAVSSAHAGARKPHPLIYRHTLDTMDANAATTLFVGDSWEPDVTGPIASGMRSVHIHRTGAVERELPEGASRGPSLSAVTERIERIAGLC